jgi:hypothetical protein
MVKAFSIALGLLVGSSTFASAQDIQLRVDDTNPLILGKVDKVGVRFFAPESADTQERPLRVSVNVGRFGEVTRLRAGEYEATYFLPDTRFPQVALVAVWRETGPDAPIAFLRIPLLGRTNVPVRTGRFADVEIRVGDLKFGAQADRRGRAMIPIAVPPGVSEVVATSTAGSEVTQGTIAVRVPPYNRLTLAVTPYLIPADGHAYVTAKAFYDAAGDPPPLDRILLKSEIGVLTPIGQEQNIYTFRLTPPRSSEKSRLSIQAKILGDATSRANVNVELGSPVPERIVTLPLAQPILSGTSTVVATAAFLVMDRYGLGVSGLKIRASSENVALQGGVQEGTNGEYQVTFRAPPKYPAGGFVKIEAVVAQQSGLDLSEDLLFPVSAASVPDSLEIRTIPEEPIFAEATPIVVEVVLLNAAKEPVLGLRPTATSSTGQIKDIRETGPGTYTFEALPPADANTWSFVVQDKASGFRKQVILQSSEALDRFAIAIRGGIAHQTAFSPTGGIEVSYRLPVLDDRMRVLLGGSFRRVGQTITLTGVDVERPSAELLMFPVSLGTSYDLLRVDALQVYVGGVFELIPYTYSLSSSFQADLTDNGLGWSGSGLIGASLHGFLLELNLGYANVASGSTSAAPFEASGFLFSAQLGYRFNIF